MSEISSIYIHIPFCKNICSYCDFCKMYYDEKLVDKYLDALEKEITSNYNNEKIKTIYIGGGTPSSLNIQQLDRLFQITNKFKISNTFEFTVELNINDITEEKITILKNNGVNRISIGVQTINKNILDILDRYHTEEEVIEKVNIAKKYFDNINVDFMYGFYNESMENLKYDLDFFKLLDVSHISIYSLILEEHTKLFINKIKKIDEEIESNMYYYIADYLKEAGYKHYEISNFSRNGYESKHNLVYWENKKYYGFGLGASGYINNYRYTNTRSINDYLKGKYMLEKEIITNELELEYYMILGLRKIEGINKKAFFDKYKFNINDKFDIIKLINNGMLKDENEFIFIPEDKLYISNSVLVNFIDGGSNE